MGSSDLINVLSKKIPAELAEDVVEQFLLIKSDTSTGTLERAAPGKFVETVVQILQYLAEGNYSKNFKTGEVDDFLKNAESRKLNLPDNLRLVLTRVSRGIYSLRSKRSIVHKGEIDPNIYDLRYLYYAAQWILCEVTRHLLSSDMKTAAQLIEFIQVPPAVIVENFGDKRLVLKVTTAMEELLILLSHYYPAHVPMSQLQRDMDRRVQSTISNVISTAYGRRLIEGNKQIGYKLTILGYQEAINSVKKIMT